MWKNDSSENGKPFYEPTRGTILLNGTDIRDFEITTLRRQIGYVIQQVGLIPSYEGI